MDAARASPWLWAPWVAWALGSIPVGYLLVRARLGLDVRTQGSGTVGARNVARLLGWPGFVATLGLDLLKGAAAVLLAQWAAPHHLAVPMAALLCCVVGHDFPPWIAWRGGNGIAPLLGGLMVLDPNVLVLDGMLFVVALAVLRLAAHTRGAAVRPHRAGAVALAAIPPLAWWTGWPRPALGLLAVTVVLILVTLRAASRRPSNAT